MLNNCIIADVGFIWIKNNFVYVLLIKPFRIYYALQILDGFLLYKTNEDTDMDKYWSCEELEYEKYYVDFTPEEWQKFLTYKSQVDAFHIMVP